MEDSQPHQHPLFQLLEDHQVRLPDEIVGTLDTMETRELDLLLRQIAEDDLRPVEDVDESQEEPASQGSPVLDGASLLADPDAEIRRYKTSGGTDLDLIAGYLAGQSFLHVVRTSGQPPMARATLKALVPPLARQMCAEAAVEGISAMMLAEQAAEARVDEAYHRALAGTALDAEELKKAEMLNKAADRFSRRMMKALEQLHRLHRPRVNVKISRAGNVNLGSQQVINDRDGEQDAGTKAAAEMDSPR